MEQSQSTSSSSTTGTEAHLPEVRSHLEEAVATRPLGMCTLMLTWHHAGHLQTRQQAPAGLHHRLCQLRRHLSIRAHAHDQD